MNRQEFSYLTQYCISDVEAKLYRSSFDVHRLLNECTANHRQNQAIRLDILLRHVYLIRVRLEKKYSIDRKLQMLFFDVLLVA